MMSAADGMILAANKGVNDGRQTSYAPGTYLGGCSHFFKNPLMGLIYSRDRGMLEEFDGLSGDLDNCLHLSFSFIDDGGTIINADQELMYNWARAIFRSNVLTAWVLPPRTDAHGTELEAWHFWVFCDTNWNPLSSISEEDEAALRALGWGRWSDFSDHLRALREKVH